MAYVLFCHDLQSGQMVALKLQKEGVGSPDLFLKEAKTWVSLGAHPHIVQALYASRLEKTAYIVLEMIPPTTSQGCSLRNWLDERFPIDPELVLRWMVQICDAMEYGVNRASLVHRDIKPENILISPRLDAKLTDFGLAASRMGKGAEGGTPLYMAPEQRLGRSDTRSDIYALGLVIAEMFLGRLPDLDQVTSEYLFVTLCRTAAGPPPWLRDLSTILAKCLQPLPAERYQSFSHLRMDLDRLTQRYLGVPSAKLLARPTKASAQLTNQGLAFLNLGLRDEGVRLLQKAVARSPDDAMAISRLRHELQSMRDRRLISLSDLARYMVNQLKENSRRPGWWIKIVLLAGLLGLLLAISPASAYAKLSAGAIVALLLVECFVNHYTCLTLNRFQLGMFGLCLLLYLLSWVVLPADDRPSWAEQLTGWLFGAGVFVAAFLPMRIIGLGAGTIKIFAPLVIVLGGDTWLAVLCFVIGYIVIGASNYLMVGVFRWRVRRKGVYVAEESRIAGMYIPLSLPILIAAELTLLYGSVWW
jgi:serine/threonine protein kinase